TCRPTRRKKKSVQFPGSLPLPPVSFRRYRTSGWKFLRGVATSFPQYKRALGHGCAPLPCTILPPCAPLRLRCGCPCDCKAAPRRASGRPPRVLPCCIPNPVAPVCRRCKVLRCDRSEGQKHSNVAREADRSQAASPERAALL